MAILESVNSPHPISLIGCKFLNGYTKFLHRSNGTLRISMNTSKKVCRNCNWYDPYEYSGEKEMGLCRKSIPIINQASSLGQGSWPMVFGIDWCGEFQIQE